SKRDWSSDVCSSDLRQVHRYRFAQVLAVTVTSIRRFRDNPAQLRARWAIIAKLLHGGLDLVFDRIGKFATTSGTELDAIVWHRVVLGGNPHAQISAVVIGEKCNRWGWQHANPDNIHTARC